MANFSSLKQAIQNYIKENGNKEITGNLLQEILLSMVVTMGDNAINSLTTVVNELNTILHSVDAEPTKNSVNLVRSGGVWSGINREALRAFNAETFEARFNSTNNRVEFFNQSGDMLYWYDASAFVATGLVKDVYIENDNLVFVINTSAGEKTIEVPLEDVFNPNNYYTKTQIDDIVRTIRELYDGAEYRGFITPSSQAESKQGVKMVCFATEAGTYTNFLANYDTPIVIPVRGIWVFERGVDADDWTAYSLLEIDKVYAPAQASGMGRVVLQKNMVNGVNTLTQDMFYKGEVGSRVPNTNTIFVIEYDFILGEDITVPANCVLEFDGGSISAGTGENKDTITGNNTGIHAGLVKIFNTNITLAGSWNVAEAYPEWFGAISNEVIDCTLAIQKTLDSFSCCYLHEGNYKITSYINVTGNIYGQYSKSIIKPYHDGDVFRLTAAKKSIIGLTVKGGEWNGPYIQPRTGTAGAAFVVGYNGANAQNCRIQDCVIYVFYGIGILWENGSKLIAENVTISEMTSDGIRGTATYDDNHEGTFLNTHIVNCEGIGYNLMDGETRKDNRASSCNCFINTKGFGNNPNYYIGTIGNYGWIMTKLPKSPSRDELGSKSAGNSLMVYSTETEFGRFIDNGVGNVLSGYSVWDLMVDRKRYIKELYINCQLEGYHKFTQTGNRVFEDSFIGTTGSVTVNHAKGTASGRNDVFEGIKGKNQLLEFSAPDGNHFNYFEQTPYGGPLPIRIKNDNGTFEDPFVICPIHNNYGYRWGIGTKTGGNISVFVQGEETLKITKNTSILKTHGSSNTILTGLNGPTSNRPLDTIKNNNCIGSIYLDTTIGKPTWLLSFDTWYNPAWIEADGAKAGVKRSGTWSERPIYPAHIYEGFKYMLNDTNLHMPIYAHLKPQGTDPEKYTIEWYKADGTQYTG